MGYRYGPSSNYRFGPILSKSMTQTYPTDDYAGNTFWGFDENDSELLRYPMSYDLQNAITQCLRNLENCGSKPLDLFLAGWDDDAQDQIRAYATMFQNCEVIPYIYPLKKVVVNSSADGYQSLYAMSSAGRVDAWQATDPTYYKQSGFSNTEQNLTMLSGYGPDIGASLYSSSLSKWCGFFQPDLAKNELMRKSDATDIVGYFSTNKIKSSISTSQASLRHYYYQTDLGDLYGGDIAGVDLFKTPSEFVSDYGEYSHLTHFLEIRDNSQNGTYSSSNKRPVITQKLGIGGSAQGNQRSLPLFFFVKTFMPWLDENGNPTGKESVQYWAFNVLTLFMQRGLEYNYTKADDDSWGFLALGVVSADTPGGVKYPRPYYPPFPYYVRQYCREFTDDNSALVSLNNSTTSNIYNPSDYFDWYGDATHIGCKIICKNEQIIQFFNEELGVKITDNSDEFTSKNTEDWKISFISSPPGTGGQTGGEAEGGGGIGGTDYGDTSDDVSSGGSNTSGGGFLSRRWALNGGNVLNLQAALTESSIWNAITNFFKDNPTEGILGLVKIPFPLENYTTINDQTITILGDEVSWTTGGGDTRTVQGSSLPQNLQSKIEVGSFDFEERFGSFLDYSPYTKISLYLPFFGFTDLSADAVMRRRLKVYYDIDYSTGAGLAILYTSNNTATASASGKYDNFLDIDSGGYSVLKTVGGQVGIQVPLTSSNAAEKTQSAIKSVLTATAIAVAGVATAGVGAGAAAGVASTTATAGQQVASQIVGNTAMNTANVLLSKPQYTGGTAPAEHAYVVNGVRPFVSIEYPITNMPKGYESIAGYQSNIYQKLLNMSGFTMCENIKLEGVSCTQGEADEIKALLSKGVII